jgi:hypothetical protein
MSAVRVIRIRLGAGLDFENDRNCIPSGAPFPARCVGWRGVGGLRDSLRGAAGSDQRTAIPLLAGVLSFVPAVLRPGSGFDLVALPAAVVLAVASFSWGFSLHRRGYIFALPFAAGSLIGSGWLWAPPPVTRFFLS